MSSPGFMPSAYDGENNWVPGPSVFDQRPRAQEFRSAAAGSDGRVELRLERAPSDPARRGAAEERPAEADADAGGDVGRVGDAEADAARGDGAGDAAGDGEHEGALALAT